MKLARLKYIGEKIKNSLKSGTFREKGLRFLDNQVKRYISVPIRLCFDSNKGSHKNVADGFKDHRSSQEFMGISEVQVARIISAYKMAKRDQINVLPGYEIAGLWDEWVALNFREVISGLEEENVARLTELFNNIIREQCTLGLGGYDEYFRYNSFLGKSYIKLVWNEYYRKLVDLQGQKEIIFPMVGNPCGMFYDGKVIPIESLRHAYRAEEIAACLSDVDNKVVVEIGGGYGGLGFQLGSKMKDSNMKFILFDIPEVVAISSAFLITALPDKVFRFYGEGAISADDKDFDFGIFPHFSIENLENDSIDLFYNSCSFSEMDGGSSRKYMAVIERCCRKYFMHDNHETRFTFLQTDGTYSTNLVGSELIPSSVSFKQLYKKPRTHGLPEDSSFKHFEYLYERKKTR